jgi:hypothetical protein
MSDAYSPTCPNCDAWGDAWIRSEYDEKLDTYYFICESCGKEWA